ncbi:unnamed protein product [Mucor hiemalis]
MTNKTNYDVLVSGAGPVGLFFAYQMAVRGHSVCIVDPKSGPTDQSRAILITARTLEILENKGFAADILYESFAASGMRLFRKGEIVAQIDANGDTPFPHLTGLMQGFTERIFNERIQEDTDLKIDWCTELLSYTQDDNEVTAVICNVETKEKRTVTSKYIVGADGTHSRVRKENPDWTFKGVAIHTKFGLVDLTLKGKDVKLLSEKMNVFMSGTSVMGVLRINPIHETEDDTHVFRIFGNLEQYSRGVADENNPSHGIVKKQEDSPTREFVENWLKEKVAPLEVQIGDTIIWSTFFRINERMANGFRRNRAFLVGDAAHCHSPVGGQGMNLGIQDADNLAWKLSDVLNNLSSDPEKLLNSYGLEREPHAKATIDMTSKSTQAGLSGSEFYGYCRTYMVSTALMLPQIRQLAFKTAMQLWVTVDPNTSNILGTSSKGLIQPGQFFPESSTLRKSFVSKANKQRLVQRNSIHELLIGSQQHAVIFIGTCLAGSRPNEHLMEKFWKNTRSYPIRRLVIQSPWHSHLMKFFPEYITKEEEAIAENSFYCEERIDLPISLTNRVGLYPMLTSYFATQQPPSVILIVRPDLYVAGAKLVYNEKDVESALEFITSSYVTSNV